MWQLLGNITELPRQALDSYSVANASQKRLSESCEKDHAPRSFKNSKKYSSDSAASSELQWEFSMS
jgi:hypothetical protein